MHRMLTVISSKLKQDRIKEKSALLMNKETARNYSRSTTFYNNQEVEYQAANTEKAMQSILSKPINSKDSAKPAKSALKNAKEGNDNKYKIKLSNVGLKSLCDYLEDYQNFSQENQSYYGNSIDLDVVKKSSIFDEGDAQPCKKNADEFAKLNQQFEDSKVENQPELVKHGKKARFVRKISK